MLGPRSEHGWYRRSAAVLRNWRLLPDSVLLPQQWVQNYFLLSRWLPRRQVSALVSQWVWWGVGGWG